MPFRLLLQQVAELLAAKVEGWEIVVRYLAEMHGAESAHVEAWHAAVAESRSVLLILDGLDEAHAWRAAIVSWIKKLDATAMGRSAFIVVTSPAGGGGGQGSQRLQRRSACGAGGP